VAALMIVPVAVLMLVTSVEAKTYDNFAGHSAVQYYQSDMDYPLSEYIERVEYDTDYGANGPGVRLYLTENGKDMINSESGSEYLSIITDYVTGRQEWRSDRSYVSIATEIAEHCLFNRVSPTHIEYFYSDLKSWEKPVYGR